MTNTKEQKEIFISDNLDDCTGCLPEGQFKAGIGITSHSFKEDKTEEVCLCGHLEEEHPVYDLRGYIICRYYTNKNKITNKEYNKCLCGHNRHCHSGSEDDGNCLVQKDDGEFCDCKYYCDSQASVNMHTTRNREVEMVKHSPDLINQQLNEGTCTCGHHSKDHSYSLAPNCSDLECDKCGCMNYSNTPVIQKDMTNPINQELERINKGCGKLMNYNSGIPRVCGTNYKDFILYLCPTCQTELSQAQKMIKIFEEMIDKREHTHQINLQCARDGKDAEWKKIFEGMMETYFKRKKEMNLNCYKKYKELEGKTQILTPERMRDYTQELIEVFVEELKQQLKEK